MSLENKECICEGNFREIIKDTEPLFDKEFVDSNDNTFILSGILYASEDFYYCMWSSSGCQYLSCLLKIEDYGFTLKE
jgi:hypothetical protein